MAIGAALMFYAPTRKFGAGVCLGGSGRVAAELVPTKFAIISLARKDGKTPFDSNLLTDQFQ